MRRTFALLAAPTRPCERTGGGGGGGGGGRVARRQKRPRAPSFATPRGRTDPGRGFDGRIAPFWPPSLETENRVMSNAPLTAGLPPFGHRHHAVRLHDPAHCPARDVAVARAALDVPRPRAGSAGPAPRAQQAGCRRAALAAPPQGPAACPRVAGTGCRRAGSGGGAWHAGPAPSRPGARRLGDLRVGRPAPRLLARDPCRLRLAGPLPPRRSGRRSAPLPPRIGGAPAHRRVRPGCARVRGPPPRRARAPRASPVADRRTPRRGPRPSPSPRARHAPSFSLCCPGCRFRARARGGGRDAVLVDRLGAGAVRWPPPRLHQVGSTTFEIVRFRAAMAHVRVLGTAEPRGWSRQAPWCQEPRSRGLPVTKGYK